VQCSSDCGLWTWSTAYQFTKYMATAFIMGFNTVRSEEFNLCYNWMCVTSKLVTLCHYIVLTHTVFCDAMQTISLIRPTGYQIAAMSESMHQSKSIKSLWNTASVYTYTTQLFGKLCSTQLHTSQCKGYVPLTLLNFTCSFLT